MVQIIKIIEDNILFGVKYGLVVIPEPQNTVPQHLLKYKAAQAKAKKCRTNKMNNQRTRKK
ncbi:MAG: hypothetical protein II208_04785 [Alphaproteobacteria bacterium]|nr:hypothetical protein [Alphaproteobacteria bacterium]